jgi:hypothetical protein
MNEITIQDNNDGFMTVNNLDQALKVADIIAKSSFCPKQFIGKPGDILIAMQMGRELGLKPLQALQNIAVINGNPSLWGDAMLALCQQHASYEYVAETFDEVAMTATCRAKRKGQPEVVALFSKADAEKAGLWGKNVWANYPKRMLAMRARGFALRDTWADALRGLISREEAQDIPQEEKKPTVFEKMANVIVECITGDQLELLNAKIDEAKADVIAMCQHYKIESLDFVPKHQYAQLMGQLDKKIAKQKAETSIEQEAANSDITAEEFFKGVE